MARLLILLAALVAAASAQPEEMKLSNAKAALNQLGNKIEAGVDKAIDAAGAWNKTVLVDAALHTSKTNPCKTGYMMDAAGKCTVCDFTLSMVPGCNACVDPGTCSGCGEGYNFVAAATSPNSLVSGTCICDLAHLNDSNCVQCTIAGSCDQCVPGFFPNPDTKVCQLCDANCLVCDDVGTCNVCAPRFALASNGTCLACPAGCAQCHVDGFNPDAAAKKGAPAEFTVCDACDSNLFECPNGGALFGTCNNLLTDAANCGACGVTCPAAAACADGACVCPDTQPVAPVSTNATCDQTYDSLQQTATYAYPGPYTAGDAFTATYQDVLLPVPTRYVVRADAPCGPIVADTGFTGEWAYGCAASSPCCDAVLGGGCVGNATGTADCTPGGGATGNKVVTLPSNVTGLYVTAYSVCGDTQNADKFTLGCPSVPP